MRITQCKVGSQVLHFDWKRTFEVTDYENKKKPCVFFGCYNKNDLRAILRHEGPGVIYWAGRDILRWQTADLIGLNRFIHITTMKQIVDEVMKRGHECQLVPLHAFRGMKPNPLVKTNKIYAYYQRNGLYSIMGHNKVDKRIQECYNVVVPVVRYDWEKWYDGICDSFYNAFVGLMLDDFARGGTTIKDMGLRGIKCITNVIDLPNCIHWKTPSDIYTAIEREKMKVGTSDPCLANKVFECLDWKFDWLWI